MRHPTSTRLAVVAVTVLAGLMPAAPAGATLVYGVTDTDRLVAFDTAAPATAVSSVAITGLGGGESVAALDFRPATLQLYALGGSGRLYELDTVTGAATAVGEPLALDGGPEYDIDFNPRLDRLRVVSEGGLNLRADPNLGGPDATTDGALAYAAGDPNAGEAPGVVGAAYTNSRPASAEFPSVPATELFGIDSVKDVLVLQAPPNPGRLNTVGPLGVDVGDVAGFDIVTSADGVDAGYAALRPQGRPPRLYAIDTATGAATDLGPLPSGHAVRDISVAPDVPVFAVLVSGVPQSLAIVRADRPGVVVSDVAISGLRSDERLLAIDTRPSNGRLYGLGSSSRLYRLDAVTGAASAVAAGAFTPAIAGGAYGFDFNPAAGSFAFRLLAGTANSTLGATDALHTLRSPLAYREGDPNESAAPNVRFAAYTAVTEDSPQPRLFDIDVDLDATVQQRPFNPGVLRTVGPLGVDVSDVGGFEAVPKYDQQFAALEATPGRSTLFTINGSATAAQPNAMPPEPATAANGSAAAIGDIGLPPGRLAEGLAVVASTPEPAVAPPSPPAEPTSPHAPGPPRPLTPPTVRRKVGLRVQVQPERDRRRPFRFQVRGALVPRSSEAAGSQARIVVRRAGSHAVRHRGRARLGRRGGFSQAVVFRRARQLGRRSGRLSFRVVFLGGPTLRRSRTVERHARYGRRAPPRRRG